MAEIKCEKCGNDIPAIFGTEKVPMYGGGYLAHLCMQCIEDWHQAYMKTSVWEEITGIQKQMSEVYREPDSEERTSGLDDLNNALSAKAAELIPLAQEFVEDKIDRKAIEEMPDLSRIENIMRGKIGVTQTYQETTND